LIDKENDFIFIRSHLLNKPTISERQMAFRIAKTIDPKNKEIVGNPLVKPRLDQALKWLNNLIIHYTHEKRLETYKKDVHPLWNQILANTPVMNTKLIIGNRNSRNITREMLHKCPHHILSITVQHQTRPN